MSTIRYAFIFYASGILLISSCGRMKPDKEALKLNEWGLKLQDSGRYEEAIQKFRMAQYESRNNSKYQSQILRNIALAFAESGTHDSAAYYFHEAANSYGKGSPEQLTNDASSDIYKGNLKEAIKKLEKVIEIAPGDPSANNELGLIYLGSYGQDINEPQKALKYNEMAYRSNPANWRVKYTLAINYFALGMKYSAEELFQELVKEVEYADFYHHLGMIQYQDKRFNEAEQNWQHCLELDSSYSLDIKVFKAEEENKSPH